MRMPYAAASNIPLHVGEINGNEESTLSSYNLVIAGTALTMRFNLDVGEGLAIGSGLSIDIIPVGYNRLRVTTNRTPQPIRAANDLPTRAAIVRQFLDAGLTPIEASEMASIEIEIGMAKDD